MLHSDMPILTNIHPTLQFYIPSQSMSLLHSFPVISYSTIPSYPKFPTGMILSDHNLNCTNQCE